MEMEALVNVQEKEKPLELSVIEETACRAREEFEAHSIDSDVLAGLYQQYNPDVGDVSLFIQRARGLFPDLNCGLASICLRERLPSSRVVNGKYENEDHTFLLVQDDAEIEHVVDITSDQ